jgi:uncharacterized protein (TIGR00725 family)
MAFQVAVCGPSDCTEAEYAAAHEVGVLLARRGATVLCGGGSGVMAAVSAGAATEGGTVVGILPGRDTAAGNADLTVAIATNMGEARNAVLIASADAVIAVGGSWGTLSEIAFGARRGGVAVVCLNGWQILRPDGTAPDGLLHVGTAREAVDAALGGTSASGS